MSQLFAVCSPGLEPFMAQEMSQLGLRPSRSPSPPEYLPAADEWIDEVGGVGFQGSLADMYRANLHLRTASRVSIRLGNFYADTFSDLGRRAKRLPWEGFLKPGQAVSLRVSCHKSRLFHSDAVAERILEAIGDRLGQIPSLQNFNGSGEENLPQLILVRLLENRCSIHLDSSGSLLSKRGYRLATGKAPLRETLAAGILLASGWDILSPLLDPFCGSGTIAIEAARLARKIPPGFERRFAFMDWPNFMTALWEKISDEAKNNLSPSNPKIVASDRDEVAIQAARANAERAGVANSVEFSRRAFSSVDPPRGPGWVVTNPPYGIRLKTSKNLHGLYAELGKVLRAKCSGWRVAMLCSRVPLWRATGLESAPGIPLRNGGLKVLLMRGLIK